MNINHSPKLGTIQAVLHILNAKFKNTKISTTIYSVCVCVRFLVSGMRSMT